MPYTKEDGQQQDAATAFTDQKSVSVAKYWMKKFKHGDERIARKHNAEIETTAQRKRASHEGWPVKDCKKKETTFGRDRFGSRQNAKQESIAHEREMEGLSRGNRFK